MSYSTNQRGPTSALSSPLHRNRGGSNRSNTQGISAKAFTDFTVGTGVPGFLCKGVCLGGALHRNPGMKRAETRNFGMSWKERCEPRESRPGALRSYPPTFDPCAFFPEFAGRFADASCAGCGANDGEPGATATGRPHRGPLGVPGSTTGRGSSYSGRHRGLRLATDRHSWGSSTKELR